MKTNIYIIILLLTIQVFTYAQYSRVSENDTLVRIGSTVITTDDYLRRAEYTIRPPYCKGDGGIDKKIVLNSLIAEKLIALEAKNKEDNIYKNSFFTDFIKGRKEQLMRQILGYTEGPAKVIPDSVEIKKEFANSCKTYKVKFLIVDNESAIKASDSMKAGNSFEKLYYDIMGNDSLQSKEIEWKSPEDDNIKNALYSREIKKSDIIGPIEISDTTSIILKVEGWKEQVLLTDKDIRDRLDEVKEKIVEKKGNEIYSEFIQKVMDGKSLLFNKENYPKLLRATDPYYIISSDKKKESFLDMAFEKPGKGLISENIDDIKTLPVFTLDGKTWTTEDLENEMRSHPLVFRKKKFTRKEYPELFKLAVADLIRDKYLTEIAYKRNYDTIEYVKRQTEMWEDASSALFEKYKMLANADTTGKNWMYTIEQYMEPLTDSLIQKYSGIIEINTDLFNKIKLTRIDLVTLEPGTPYPVYVPSFPMLTTKNKIDYGRKLK